MDGAADFDEVSGALVDSYLLYLRGRGPEPDISALTSDQRRRVREQFAIVAALADRAPALPPLDDDPVAIRLGLAAAAEPPAGWAAGDPIPAALGRLELRLDRQVAVDYSPVWTRWHSAQLSAVAQCSALGNSVALFTTPSEPLADDLDAPAVVAAFLRQYPDISAVCLTSSDASEAVLLTAADANASLDPVRGWLEPGIHTAADFLEVTLGRYFEARLPRWDRVAALTDLIDLGDVGIDALEAATAALASARRMRPRLHHKREAIAALRALEPSSIGDVVAEVQSGRLRGDALVSRLSALAGAVAS